MTDDMTTAADIQTLEPTREALVEDTLADPENMEKTAKALAPFQEGEDTLFVQVPEDLGE